MKLPLARFFVLIGALVTLTAAFSDTGGFPLQQYLDIKAALLVFVMPLLVLAFYQKEPVALRMLWARFGQVRRRSNVVVFRELLDTTEATSAGFSSARVVSFGEKHNDDFVRYCSELYASKFSAAEMEDLLSNRIEAEEKKWSNLYTALGFLAKMAPYFGMLATVIGMSELLRHMSDFNKISGSMALAMQGTLYGLFSFTMVYSPMQKAVMGIRDNIRHRNLLIARWFLMVADKAEPALIRQELLSHLPNEPKMLAVKASSAARPSGEPTL